MTQEVVYVGSESDDGTGDPIRTAFQKINSNFSEIYGQFPGQFNSRGTYPAHGFYDTDGPVDRKSSHFAYNAGVLGFHRYDDEDQYMDTPLYVESDGRVVCSYSSYGPAHVSYSGGGGWFSGVGSNEANRTGWCEWRRQDGTRIAYMGYTIDGSNDVDFYVDNPSTGFLNLGNTGLKTHWGVQGRAGVGGAVSNWFNKHWTGSQAQLWVDSSNVGVISLTSDGRYKHSVETLELEATDQINSLRPVSYRWRDLGIFKDDGEEHLGFIAQEVAEVIPDAVSGSEEETLSIDILPLLATMVKAMQEMSRKIEELEAKLS